MLIVASVLAGLAALLHVYIFRLESLAWTDPATRKVFGTTPETAEVTKPLAYNQGFYNLFLAIITVIGIVLVAASDSDSAGKALIYAACGSMVAAALVLVTNDSSKLRAAVVQGAAPALAIVALILS